MRAIFPAILFASFCLMLVLSTSSCTYDSVCPGEFPCDSAEVEPCDSNRVYFEADVLPILEANCAFSGCHDEGTASSNVILTDYNNVVNTAGVRAGEPEQSKLYTVLVEQDPAQRMPPGGPLPASQIQTIKDWIEEGAQNLKCDTASGGGCDIIDVSYSQTVKPVLETNCISCHQQGNARGGIRLDGVTRVRAAQSGNRFFGSINHEPGFSRMPQGGQKLDQCTLDQIKSWIDDGMRDN